MSPASSAILSRPRNRDSTPIRLERDLRGGLGEIECRRGDGVELDEPHRLEHDTGRDGVRPAARTHQASLQLVVARLRDLGDRGERLGQLGAGIEPELGSLAGPQQVARVARGRPLRRPVESRICARSRSGSPPAPVARPIIALGKRQRNRERLPVP